MEWENSIYLHGNIVSEITKLKNQDGPLLQVHGSWQMIKELLKHNLVDELQLWTFPVIVGSGKRLFTEGVTTEKLSLIKSEACANGAAMSIYRAIGEN